MAPLPPDFGEVHAALEVSNIDLGPLAERLHEQQLQQYALSAARGAAQQNVGDVSQIDRHRPRKAFPKGQHEAVLGKIGVTPAQQIRQAGLGGNGIHQHPTFALAIDDFHDGHIQGRFYRRPLVLPYREGDTLVSELPDRHTWIVVVPLFME